MHFQSDEPRRCTGARLSRVRQKRKWRMGQCKCWGQLALFSSTSEYNSLSMSAKRNQRHGPVSSRPPKLGLCELNASSGFSRQTAPAAPLCYTHPAATPAHLKPPPRHSPRVLPLQNNCRPTIPMQRQERKNQVPWVGVALGTVIS